MLRLRKFRDDAKEVYDNNEEKDNVSLHFKRVVLFYDNALTYIKTLPSFHIGYDYATRELVDLALSHVEFHGKRVLEIGCGLGNTLIFLANRFNTSCVGTDLNAKEIEICQQKINSLGLTSEN